MQISVPITKLCTNLLGGLLCLCSVACDRSSEAEVDHQNQVELVVVEGLATVDLIDLLAHPNELTRARAHHELLRYLVVETNAVEHPERLTLFHKHAPHACKAEHEAQTLHILGVFAALRDISSILVEQSLRSKHARVRATSLELAHFSDNQINETLLAFDPDSATFASYQFALEKLGTPEAAKRLASLADAFDRLQPNPK